MNRDLTINLKINAASSENAKAASDTVKAVTDAARAGTVAANQFAQAQQTAASAASSMATAARSVGAAVTAQSQSYTQAASSTEQYAHTMSKLDAKFAELEQGIGGLNESLDAMDNNRKRAAAADREFLEGVQRLSNGITSMARSVILLTAANEDDAAAMLKMIARFESVAQALNGVIGVVQGATKAWQQYAIAAELAGVAATVAGFAGKVGKVGGIAALATASAGVTLGGAAIMYQNYDNYVNGTNKTYAEDFVSSSAISLVGPSAGFAYGVGTLKTYQDAYLSRQKTAKMEEELTDRQRLNRRRDDFARIAEIENMTKSQVVFETDLQQSRFVAGLQDPSRNPNWRDSFQSAYRVNTVTANSLEDRKKELEKAIGDDKDGTKDQVALERNKRELEEVERRITDTARERLSIMQQEAETANRIVAAQREGLAQMSRGDARSLANAIRSAADGSLNAREIDLLRRNNIQGYDDVIRKSEETIIAQDANKNFIYRDQQQKNQVDELNKNYNIAVNSEMVLKVQAEIDKSAPQWISEAMKFIQQQVERIKEEAKAVIELHSDEQRRQADANSKAKDGGPGVIPANAGRNVK